MKTLIQLTGHPTPFWENGKFFIKTKDINCFAGLSSLNLLAHPDED